MEGLLSTGPTPSSFERERVMFDLYSDHCLTLLEVHFPEGQGIRFIDITYCPTCFFFIPFL